MTKSLEYYDSGQVGELFAWLYKTWLTRRWFSKRRVMEMDVRLNNTKMFLPEIRTNYGKFSLKFQEALVWNQIPDNLKHLCRSSFKKKLKISYTVNY